MKIYPATVTSNFDHLPRLQIVISAPDGMDSHYNDRVKAILEELAPEAIRTFIEQLSKS